VSHQPLWEWDWDYLLHFAVGFAVTAAVTVGLANVGIPFILATWLIPIFAGFGLWREKRQHDWRKLTGHQLAEAWLWSAGSAVAFGASLVWLFHGLMAAT